MTANLFTCVDSCSNNKTKKYHLSGPASGVRCYVSGVLCCMSTVTNANSHSHSPPGCIEPGNNFWAQASAHLIYVWARAAPSLEIQLTSEPEPSSARISNLLLSQSQAPLGFPTCFWAQANPGLDFEFVTKPSQSILDFLGPAGLSFSKLPKPCLRRILQSLVKFDLSRTYILKSYNIG